MLLVKPLYLRCKMKGHSDRKESIGQRYNQLQEKERIGSTHSAEALDNEERKTIQATDDLAAKEDEAFDLDQIIELEGSSGEHEDFSEIFIHQLIETIEFVLGTVSNTASYLRLWALSLAHSQLADVFFEKLIGSMALSGSGSFYLLFLLFPVFFSFTLFVLLCMDSMECFLHTLRLHWVEFQNKFYKGCGYIFVPFSFEADLKQVE